MPIRRTLIRQFLNMKKKASVVAIKTVTSRPVLFFWVFVSVSVAILCCWSYTQPAWTIRSSSTTLMDARAIRQRRLSRAVSRADIDDITPMERQDNVTEVAATKPSRSSIPLVYIGLFALCIYTGQEQYNTATCVTHAQLDYEWLPPAWQVTQIVCGAGCVLLLTAGVASVVAACIRQHQRQQRLIKVTALIQLLAASLMLLGLCFFPFGLQSENVEQFCNERCQPGWSSLVSGLSSVAALLCPILASLISNPIYDHNPWEAYLLL